MDEKNRVNMQTGYRYSQLRYNEANKPSEPDYIDETYRIKHSVSPKDLKKAKRNRIITWIVTLVLCTALLAVLAVAVFEAKYAKGRNGKDTDGTEASVKGDEDTSAAASSDKKTGEADAGIGTGSASITLNIAENSDKITVTDVTTVVESVLPSIVSIDNNFTDKTRTIYGVYEEDAIMTGSGVIIGKSDTELLIVTNNHVISGANEISVNFYGDYTAPAQIRGKDANMDLAVIVVNMADIPEAARNLIKVATLGDSSGLRLGEPTIAIGNALGIGQSVTTGVVSAVDREVDMGDGISGTFIQTDAAINHGNSGGALLNSRGEVIGINTAKLGGSSVEGMGFAIPITIARRTIEKLMNVGIYKDVAEENRGYLGISVEDSKVFGGDPQITGAYVSSVENGSPADIAGIKVSDIIAAVDDINISKATDLTEALKHYAAGDEAEITYYRNGIGGYTEDRLKVELGHKP